MRQRGMTSDIAKDKKTRRPRLRDFIDFVNARQNLNLSSEYAPLWEWSVRQPADFWRAVWDFFDVVGAFGDGHIQNPHAMPGAIFFADASVNVAENLLRCADESPAIIARDERGGRVVFSRAQTLLQTRQLAGWLRANGVREGDTVAAYMPNIPETVIAFLAASSIGAVFSSCSMDFGADSVCERFLQTAPKVLITADGYSYNGRALSRTNEVQQIGERLTTLQRVLHVPYLEKDSSPPHGAQHWQAALKSAKLTEFVQLPFNAPLLSLFSSGTTGAPKCIVHGGGGVLLQHLKEHGLHTDIVADDVVFYFTTCGWMMWNWLVSALAQQAAIVLYEGTPLHPTPSVLWDIAAEEGVTMFGASAKYIDAMRQASAVPIQTHQLPKLRTITSTGSPLSAEGFDFVYESIKADVHLASISGGTDIVSCFALGNPLGKVRRGELQCRGLGMDVRVLDDAGKEIINTAGELACISPFPTMPLMFRNDSDGAKYRAAYYEYFPNVWRHGDWASLSSDGMLTIYGRSDATLNPGGVRIGTAEIYRPVQKFKEVSEVVAIGQQWQNDTRIILFIVLADSANKAAVLELKQQLRLAIRRDASPRHVPSKIIVVDDIPRTRSGKISEIAVREVVHGRAVKNENALANPKSLLCFRNLPELAE